MTEQSKQWWLSWYHDPKDGSFEYHGPWWISGADMRGRDTIVAAVQAPTQEAAWNTILATYDVMPPGVDRRFTEPLAGDPWTEPGGRFPRAEWMQWEVTQ